MIKRTSLSKATKKVEKLHRNSQTLAFILQVPKEAPASSDETCQMIEIYYHLGVFVQARLSRIICLNPSLKLPIKIYQRR